MWIKNIPWDRLKCNISISNGPVAFKFYTNHETAFINDTFVSPKSLKCNISMINGPIALKFKTGVKYQKLHTKKCQWLD